jgi:hypothetical protein
LEKGQKSLVNSIDRRAESPLHNLVDRAFSWLADNIQFFNPLVGDDSTIRLRSKAMLELVLMSWLYCRQGSLRDNQHAKNFGAFAADIWQRTEFSHRLMQNEERFRLYGMTGTILVKCGVLAHPTLDIIKHIVSEGYVIAAESLPFQKLETRYILDCGGIDHHMSSYRHLYRQTLLARLYAPTHP